MGGGEACSLPRFRKISWRRAWQPTPLFLPGESQGQRSLVGPLGRKESGHDWATNTCPGRDLLTLPSLSLAGRTSSVLGTAGPGICSWQPWFSSLEWVQNLKFLLRSTSPRKTEMVGSLPSSVRSCFCLFPDWHCSYSSLGVGRALEWFLVGWPWPSPSSLAPGWCLTPLREEDLDTGMGAV